MANVYNYLIRYSYQKEEARRLKQKYIVNETGSARGDREAVRLELDKRLAKLQEMVWPGKKITIVEAIVQETEVPDGTIFEGIVREDGDYEDWDVYVGEEVVRDIISTYRDQKIRVTIEVID